MKKYLAVLCATMLCVCCLALAACGGSSSSSAASASASSASASASASASSASASASSSAAAAATFAGEWKLGAVESQGVKMAGDFSNILGTQTGASMTLAADGTGKMTLGDESADLTWKETGTGAATITVVSSSGTTTDVNAKLADGVLSMEMVGEDFSGVLYFSADGVIPGVAEIDLSKATNITSEDALVGKWQLAGVNMMGISMYAEPDALASAIGDTGTDTSITFEAGGKVTLMGESATYTVGADGATITSSGMNLPVKALGNDIAIDFSGLVTGMEMTMVFSK